jgi:predicted nucleotide-binding protein
MADVRLVAGLEAITEKIDALIKDGRELQLLPANSISEIEALRDMFFTWGEYTSTLLQNSFEVKGVLTLSPNNEFTASDIDIIDLKFGAPKTPEHIRMAVTSTLDKKLRVLESIRGRLNIWAQTPTPIAREISGEAIFLVHGHDHGAREFVRGFLERCTSREIIVLDEKAGGGADILGKLLTHAQKAAYAVILLTGDDEGRAIGAGDLQPRARQNVILELGLFIGLLGRERVIALYEPGVEIPSDYLGVTYVELDRNKAWRIGLVSELRVAGIEASIDKTL